MSHKKSIVFIDLDGTLLRDDKTVSAKDLETLHQLEDSEYICVAATGRSFYSANHVLKNGFPIDYLIFSTGAGICNWTTKDILLKYSITSKQVAQVSDSLINLGVDFSIHAPIPDTHKFSYYFHKEPHPDFVKLLKLYKDYVAPAQNPVDNFGEATQVRAIIDGDVDLFETIKNKNQHVKVIRASSPISYKAIWIEFFAKEVSKGNAADWLCNYLNIEKENTISVGNDYNDIELLDFTKHSFVVENAPIELKKRYSVTTSNNENPVSAIFSGNRKF